MPIRLFLMWASFLAWFGFVVGMMVRGVDPQFVGGGAFVVLAIPLLVLPAFNFSPFIQLNLVLAPASKYFVLAVFIVSCVVLAYWARGAIAIGYVIVFWSIWIQLLVLRFLVRRYFRTAGIYPGDVVASPWWAWENMKLPLKNRLYAMVLLLIGFSQMMLLVIFK